MSNSNSDLSKFPTPAQTPLHNVSEVWLSTIFSNYQSMEIVILCKNFLFQQKFQKKLHHFNRNSQVWGVI